MPEPRPRPPSWGRAPRERELTRAAAPVISPAGVILLGVIGVLGNGVAPRRVVLPGINGFLIGILGCVGPLLVHSGLGVEVCRRPITPWLPQSFGFRLGSSYVIRGARRGRRVLLTRYRHDHNFRVSHGVLTCLAEDVSLHRDPLPCRQVETFGDSPMPVHPLVQLDPVTIFQVTPYVRGANLYTDRWTIICQLKTEREKLVCAGIPAVRRGLTSNLTCPPDYGPR